MNRNLLLEQYSQRTREACSLVGSISSNSVALLNTSMTEGPSLSKATRSSSALPPNDRQRYPLWWKSDLLSCSINNPAEDLVMMVVFFLGIPVKLPVLKKILILDNVGLSLLFGLRQRFQTTARGWDYIDQVRPHLAPYGSLDWDIF